MKFGQGTETHYTSGHFEHIFNNLSVKIMYT